jgi:hypothetical protein
MDARSFIGSFTTGDVTWAGDVYSPNAYASIEPGNEAMGVEQTSFAFNGFLRAGLISKDDVRYRMSGGRITFFVGFPIPDPDADHLWILDPTPGVWVTNDGYVGDTDMVDEVNFKVDFESVQTHFSNSLNNIIGQFCDLTLAEGKCPVVAADIEYDVDISDLTVDGLSFKFTAHPKVGFKRGLVRPGGDNLGQILGFKDATNVGDVWTVTLYDTPPFPMANGETVTVREGCEKIKAQCDIFNPADVAHSAGWPARIYNPPGADWMDSKGAG